MYVQCVTKRVNEYADPYTTEQHALNTQYTHNVVLDQGYIERVYKIALGHYSVRILVGKRAVGKTLVKYIMYKIRTSSVLRKLKCAYIYSRTVDNYRVITIVRRLHS